MNLQELKEIINRYKDKIIFHKNISYSGHLKNNVQLLKEINNKYNNIFKSMSEFIYLINHNISEKFCYCGKFKNFIDINHGYKHYCSNKCQANNIINRKQYKQTMLNRYGVDHNSKMLSVRQKYEKNKKYIIEKIRQTSLKKDKNGLNAYQRIHLKNIQKCLEQYGKTSYLAVDVCRNKGKQTKKQKYNNEKSGNPSA